MSSDPNAAISHINLNSNYWFLCCTLLFFIVRVVTIPSNLLDSTTPSGSYNNFTDKTMSMVYIILVIFVMIYLNSEAIKEKCATEKADTYLVFLTTVFPWLSIFGMLYAMLISMPGWKAPFSNTVGYLIAIYFMGGKQKLIDLIDTNNKSDNTLIEVISNNTTVLINEYGSENIGKLKQLNKIRGNSSPFIPYDGNGNDINKKKYNKVARLILIKDFISEFVWYILTGFLVISITTNYILEQNCI